jgi:hypothetical protein
MKSPWKGIVRCGERTYRGAISTVETLLGVFQTKMLQILHQARINLDTHLFSTSVGLGLPSLERIRADFLQLLGKFVEQGRKLFIVDDGDRLKTHPV